MISMMNFNFIIVLIVFPRARVDHTSFLDCLSPFVFLLIDFQCTFSMCTFNPCSLGGLEFVQCLPLCVS